MKRILLISPDSDNESLWITGEEDPAKPVMNNMVPLGLATVAALTESRIQVDIWDELVHGLIEPETRFEHQYDLVGLTGYKVHMPRCRRIASIFRKRRIPVAIGGPGVSGTPDAYRGDFDILFIGEAEKTWPQFLKDWEDGRIREEYRQIEKPDLSDSPSPKWDSLIDVLEKYAMGCVQTTRGCPFDCEFCDVIYLFGRRSRHKPISRVLQEVKSLERLGVSTVFFCDDEFIGEPRYAKELLRQLVPLNNSFDQPLSYSTQLTMNLSKDEELLELMADANFNLVFIGIETPNKASLKETSKFQNVRQDLVGDVRKILSYGIAIRAGTIVGFDHDDETIFDTQYDFIQQAYLPSLAINMLKAPLGTKLWSRLRQEGRVVTLAKLKDRLGHPRSYTNILPKLLTRVELMRGYKDLLLRVHDWDSFRQRMLGFVSVVKRRPRVHEPVMSPEDARRVCQRPDLPDKGRQVIDDLIDHTARVAPFMMRRVKTAIVQFVHYRETLLGMIPQIDRQIELESQGRFPLIADDRPVTIPVSFRSAYSKLFPDVYRRVYLNLSDKRSVPQALTEVFVDFLLRWGDGFQRLEPYHSVFLDEIADRSCAKFNGEPPETFVPRTAPERTVPSVTRIRLAEDVLKSVEQELFNYVRKEARA